MIHVIYFDKSLPELKLQAFFDTASEFRAWARHPSVKVLDLEFICDTEAALTHSEGIPTHS